jgi:folylpolyglutamate synthase/dihydropteroate synthase
MADKDCNYIASRIGSVASEVFCLTPDNPRALNAKDYSEIYKKMGVKSSYYSTVKDAVYAAIKDAIENNKAVFCVGSLYMYCEIAEHVDEFLKNK